MLASSVLIGSLILLSPSVGVLGAPQLLASTAGQSIGLKRRPRPLRNETEWTQWAKRQRDTVIAKYGQQQNAKRATGENLIVDQGYDSNFYGTLAIGTPPFAFDVVLDTGSADLWVASLSCDASCAGTGNFDPGLSSTFKDVYRAFNVTYGSGEVMGVLVEDVVMMAGFAVANQQFGAVISTSSNFLQEPVTGLVGLGWQSLSSSGAMPFWQALVSKGSWDAPLMAFQLTRYINATQAGDLEPGGSFSMGYVNESLYTGDIDYQDIPEGQASYWVQEVTCDNNCAREFHIYASGYASYAVIDTGTTLVAGPASGIAAIYAQIPDSSPGTGEWEGFYSYPCSSEVIVEISFGGPSWTISPADFQFQPTGFSDYCYGAFYSVPASPNMPSWIIGDTFLKNVYSVFRYDPPSVGFAALSETALAMNGVNGNIPSATIGASVASVTNGSASMMPHPSSGVMLLTSALLSLVTLFS